MGMSKWNRSFAIVLRTAACLTVLLGCLASTAAAQQGFGGNVKEAYFPFNIYNRVIDKSTLDANAAYLQQNPNSKMWIQGYADPRGDIVYNLVLSYHRAQWVKAQLVKRGVDASRIEYATGWGKLYQNCDQKDEKCWQQNRRADTVTPDSQMFHWAQ